MTELPKHTFGIDPKSLHGLNGRCAVKACGGRLMDEIHNVRPRRVPIGTDNGGTTLDDESQARALLADAELWPIGHLTRDDMIARAQVHALLALRQRW